MEPSRVAEAIGRIWARETRAIGPTNLEEIIEDVSEGRPVEGLETPKGGSSLDLETVLKLITAVAGLIKVGLELYPQLRKRLNRPATVKEIDAVLPASPSLRPADRAKVAEAVLNLTE